MSEKGVLGRQEARERPLPRACCQPRFLKPDPAGERCQASAITTAMVTSNLSSGLLLAVVIPPLPKLKNPSATAAQVRSTYGLFCEAIRLRGLASGQW